MLIRDSKNCEIGQQRRTTASGRQLHCCCICGAFEVWGLSWSYYGSYEEEENGVALPKFCSNECRGKGGRDAILVTTEMKERAKAAEWREPDIKYRQATDKEKWRAALDLQRALSTPSDSERK